MHKYTLAYIMTERQMTQGVQLEVPALIFDFILRLYILNTYFLEYTETPCQIYCVTITLEDFLQCR
jgi:hypothetical protein